MAAALDSGEFAEALAASAVKTGTAIGQAVLNPVATLSGIPSGVGRFFQSAETTLSRATESRAGGNAQGAGYAADDVLGVNKAKRRIAKQVGADPYTSNPVLAKHLDDLARAAFAGGMSLDVALAVSTAGAATAISATARVSELDPAFATLHQIAGASYRRSVTALTLFGGFASTVFWPLSQFLLDTLGWRQAFYTYALLHVIVCLPIHVLAVPTGRPNVAPHSLTDAPSRAHAGPVFWWLATALSLAAFIGSAIAAHLIGLLTAIGLSARDAVLIGSLIGPMQVAGRIMEFAFNRHVRVIAIGTFAFTLMAASLAIFTQVRGVWIIALAFVIPYGWANGIMTIVRGTVPAELFGHRGYGALLGRLALPQFVLKAVAPFALTVVFLADPARVYSPYALLALAVGGLVAYRAAVRASRQ